MNFVPKGESGESEKGARSEEGTRNLEIGRVSHFCTVSPSCQPLLHSAPLVSATLHRPSVPSAHFARIRHGADGRHRLQVAAVHVSHFAHFAQAECSLGAFCLCTRCRWTTLTTSCGGASCREGESVSVTALQWLTPVHHIQLLSNVTVATFRSNFPQ